MSCNCPIKNK